MYITRRTLLQSAGAVATAAAGSTGLAATTGAREIALVAGRGPYLVVGGNGVLQLCRNYHDAVHQASVLRHVSVGQAYHIRCSPALMAQLTKDPSASWVDVDGLGVTPDEAASRGFDFLRRARNPEKTRRLLWTHHLDALHERIDTEYLLAPDTRWYAAHDGIAVCVAETREAAEAAGIIEGSPPDVHACTRVLADAICRHLENDAPYPEINASFSRHMCGEEYDIRINNDQRFHIAVTRPEELRTTFDPARAGEAIERCFEQEQGWMLLKTARRGEEDAGTSTDTLSAHLVKSLEINGFVMPGFWHRVRGVRHHLDEFASNLATPMLAGRAVRHQNRHV